MKTLAEIRAENVYAMGRPIIASMSPEVAIALVDIAVAARAVVRADRHAWPQSELDDAVIALDALVGPDS